MFKIIIVSVLLGLAISQNDEIRSYANDEPDANGAYSYQTSKEIAAQESGNSAGVSGSAQYVSLEGIPVPPSIPDQILSALENIDAHPED